MRLRIVLSACAWLLLGAVHILAAVPSGMNVQGRLTDSGGTPLPAGFKQMTFRIFDAEIGGTEIWAESAQLITSDADGLWNADIGANTPLTPAVFADTVRWLEITVDDGVNPPEMLPRVRLVTSPYAFQADRAMSSVSADSADHATHATHADTAAVSLEAAADNDWTVDNTFITTTNQRGIRKGGSNNVHFGNLGRTIVNLGITCTTGVSGLNEGYMVIGGGEENRASGDHSTVAGGRDNIASKEQSTVAGGGSNFADGLWSTVGGGALNLADTFFTTVSGGTSNAALGIGSTVSGGGNDTASGDYACIPGGQNNSAEGEYSFAAGRRAKALYEGCFVWADDTDEDFATTVGNQFIIRATNGVGINTANTFPRGLTVNGDVKIDGGTSHILELNSDEFVGGNTGTYFMSLNTTQEVTGGADMLNIRAVLGEGDGTDYQFIECQSYNFPTDVQFRVWGNGDVTADGTISGGGADFAEMLPVSTGAHSVGPGDVMVIDPNNPRALIRSSAARSTLVSGIYSTRPGFVASERDWDQVAVDRGFVKTDAPETSRDLPVVELAREIGEIPLAVVGIVPCKVSTENGPIQPGDLLVTSSTPGHAMRDDAPKTGTVLGKALGSLDSGSGVIDVLVTLQ